MWQNQGYWLLFRKWGLNRNEKYENSRKENLKTELHYHKQIVFYCPLTSNNTKNFTFIWTLCKITNCVLIKPAFLISCRIYVGWGRKLKAWREVRYSEVLSGRSASGRVEQHTQRGHNDGPSGPPSGRFLHFSRLTRWGPDTSHFASPSTSLEKYNF